MVKKPSHEAPESKEHHLSRKPSTKVRTERYTFRMTVEERELLDFACECVECDRTTLIRALINRLPGMEFDEEELAPLPIGMAAAGSDVAARHGRLGMKSRWGKKKKPR